MRADGSGSPKGTGGQSQSEGGAGSGKPSSDGPGRSGAEHLMDMLFEQEFEPSGASAPQAGHDPAAPPLSLDELREAYQESQSKVRSLSAELAGRTHALRALQSRMSQTDTSRQDVWIAEVARRARSRHRPPPE